MAGCQPFADDDSMDIGPSSRLSAGYCIDDRTRFLDQPTEHVVRSFLKAHDNPAAEENPLSRVDKIDGREVTILTESLKPSSRRSAILRRMLSMPKPRIDGKYAIILMGSAKPSSRRSAILPRMLSSP